MSQKGCWMVFEISNFGEYLLNFKKKKVVVIIPSCAK
jgi:hypothetical protein